MTTKFKKSFSPMLICWNDIKIHLGFEDSYFVPPPTTRQGLKGSQPKEKLERSKEKCCVNVGAVKPHPPRLSTLFQWLPANICHSLQLEHSKDTFTYVFSS